MGFDHHAISCADFCFIELHRDEKYNIVMGTVEGTSKPNLATMNVNE